MISIGGGYFKAPNDAFEIGLNPFQLSVYLYLVRCSNNAETAFPSLRTIQQKCGVSRPTVTKVIEELESMGLLTRRRRREGKKNFSNVYKVVEPTDSSVLTDRSVDGLGGTTSEGGKGDLPHVVNEVYHGGKGDLPYKELSYKEPDYKEKTYIDFPIDDHLYLRIYNSYFHQKFGKPHMQVTEDQLGHIMRNIDELEGYGIGIEDYREAVIEHLALLPKKNDGNILAFIPTFKRRFDVHCVD